MDPPDLEKEVEALFDEGVTPAKVIILLRGKYRIPVIDAKRIVAPAWRRRLGQRPRE